MCKSQISSLLRQSEAEIFLRLEEIIKDTEVLAFPGDTLTLFDPIYT